MITNREAYRCSARNSSGAARSYGTASPLDIDAQCVRRCPEGSLLLSHTLLPCTKRYGEAILRLLCDTQQRRTLDAILANGLHEGIPNWRVENDAIDSEGNPVLFAYTCDFPRIRRFDTALELHGMTGTLICFDYQEEALREICGQCVMLQSIDFQQFERSVLYS